MTLKSSGSSSSKLKVPATKNAKLSGSESRTTELSHDEAKDILLRWAEFIGWIGGQDGKSAYQLAVEYGYEGTEEEWLESLKGSDGVIGVNGKDGLSAYEIAVKNGYAGTEAEWIESLKGSGGSDLASLFMHINDHNDEDLVFEYGLGTVPDGSGGSSSGGSTYVSADWIDF